MRQIVQNQEPAALHPHQYALFLEHVLAPRNITFDTTECIRQESFQHFGTKQPVSYRTLEGLETTGVMVVLRQGQRDAIAAHYNFMKQKNLCEAEFAAYALETFFRCESHSYTPLPAETVWKAERMLKLTCPPARSNFWLVPPELNESVSHPVEYEWDVSPDCAYWISPQGFDPAYVINYACACFLYKGYILCPYLTIQFTKDDEDFRVAQTQALVAGAMALYNRFDLCVHSLDDDEEPTSAMLTALSHYAITFVGSRYQIWKLIPNESSPPGKWNGCRMLALDDGDCSDVSCVAMLVAWINEIHRWGLLTHAPACDADLERTLSRDGVTKSEFE